MSIEKKFENDIRDSIVNKINDNSKDNIKKLKEKLYNEMTKELLGEDVEETNSKIYKYKGFEFDVDRMSEIVTGKKKPTIEDRLANKLREESKVNKELYMTDIIDMIEKKIDKSSAENSSKFNTEYLNKINPKLSKDKTLKNITKVEDGSTIDDENKSPIIKKKTIRANTKIENIIDDISIIKNLNNNDISHYRDLKKFEDDFTALKGIGIKKADKINKYLKR